MNKNKLVTYIRPCRFPFLLMSIFIFFSGFSTLHIYSNSFDVTFIALWLTALLLLKTNAQVHFIIAFILFILAATTRIMGLQYSVLAENFAAWMYLFVTVGTIHLLLTRILNLKFVSLRKFHEYYDDDMIQFREYIIQFRSFINPFFERIHSTKNRYVMVLSRIFTIIERIVVALYRSIVFSHEAIFSYIELYKNEFSAAFYIKNKMLLAKKIGFCVLILILMSGIQTIISNWITHIIIQPHINKVEPHIVYPLNKVILRGRSLGADPNGSKVRVMSQYGEIHKDFWTDTKIIFTIPAEWKDRPLTIWIEKPVLWAGKITIEKSNPQNLKIIPISNVFTPEDDQYIEQLKHLDKETVEINGYKDK